MDIHLVVKTNDKPNDEPTRISQAHHVCNKTCEEQQPKRDCLCGCEQKHKQKKVQNKWDFELRGDVFRVCESKQGIVELYVSFGGLLCAFVGESKHLGRLVEHFNRSKQSLKEIYMQIFL